MRTTESKQKKRAPGTGAYLYFTFVKPTQVK